MLARQLWVALLVAAATASCATGGPLPPGDELEHEAPPKRTLDARGNERVPASRQPTQDELASAFEPRQPPASGNARAGGLSGAGQVPPPVFPPDPLASARQEFDAAERQVQSLLARKDLPAAREAVRALERAARALEPDHAQRAAKLAVEVASRAQDDRDAWEAARRWLLACGPAQVDRCRRQAIAALHRAMRDLGPGEEAQVVKLNKADLCVKALENSARRGGRLPACADGLRPYPFHDRLMLARAAVARGQWALRDPAREEQGLRDLERVDDACDEARCLEVRRKALRLLVDAHLRRNEPEEAARAALREVKLNAAALAPAERPWAWTTEAARACAAWDATAGEGACRKLERRIVGHHSFEDFSREQAGEGLDAERVRVVNAHYAITLQDCLAQQAARLRPPAQERYTVRWVVRNDGRVGEMHMARKDQEGSPLAECLRQQLGVWRYPRYTGEYQHVEQTFHVTAKRR